MQIGSIVKRKPQLCELSGVTNLRASLQNAANCSSKQSETRRAGRGLHIQCLPNQTSAQSGWFKSKFNDNSWLRYDRTHGISTFLLNSPVAASRRMLILVQSSLRHFRRCLLHRLGTHVTRSLLMVMRYLLYVSLSREREKNIRGLTNKMPFKAARHCSISSLKRGLPCCTKLHLLFVRILYLLFYVPP